MDPNRRSSPDEFYELKFIDVAPFHFKTLEQAEESLLLSLVPEYLRYQVSLHPELNLAEIVATARKLAHDSESRTLQETEYWRLRYQHFWGGGLEHPRDVRRLAVLEVRAAYIDKVTGRDKTRVARENWIFNTERMRLKKGELGERLDAVNRLAELGDERSLALLQWATRNDPKLAVRASARLALLARGKPVTYDPEILKDMRMGRFGERGDGYELAHEELARLPEDALRSFLDNSYLKILDNEYAEGLFANRRVAFIEEALGNPDPYIRALAIKGLEGRAEESLLPIYERALADDSVLVMAYAVEGLAKRRDPASRELLLRTAESHPKTLIQTMATERMPGEPASWTPTDLLLTRLRSADKNEAVAAARELAGRDLAVLGAALESPHAEVRLEAARALAGRRDPDAFHLVMRAFDPEREPVAEVRLTALEALYGFRTIEADRQIFAAYRDPNERVRMRAVEKSQQDSVLRAFGNLPHLHATKIVQGSEHRLARFEDAQVRVDHHTARLAAEHVYELAEAERTRDPAKLVEAQARFLAGVPRGQKVVLAGSDPETGLKLYYSAPRPGFEKEPRVLAIGGTEGILDIYADLHMGSRQAASRLLQKVKEQLLEDLRAGNDVDITGHSLGALPAGVLAYELEAARATMTNPGKVRLITWNGLGARDVLAWRKDYSPEVVARMDAINYYLPGDVVWRLGTQLGQNVRLPGEGIFRPYTSHVLSAIADATDSRGLNQARARPPVTARVAPILARNLGWIGDMLQKVHYRWREMDTLRTLLAARVEWAREKGYQELDPNFDPWKLEVDLIRENFERRNYQAGLKLIDSYEAMRQAILDSKRRPVTNPRAVPGTLPF